MSPARWRSVPKVDLHRHLEGSVRFGTFIELVREAGLDLPRRELRRLTSMRGERPGFRRFLSKFRPYRGLYPSREWIERVAFEAAEDARLDGVAYLELRFSPTHFGRRMGANGEDVAAWVARGARRAGIPVGLVATFGRDFGVQGNLPTTRAVEGTDIFCGLDLAGDESAPAAPFVPLFRRLGLPCTIHAGEAGPAGNVREAMDRFGALRIGHGVRVLEDAEVLAEAASRGVTFEICPTSEVQTAAAASWGRHPAHRMRRAGLSLSVGTDDPSICGTTLSDEFGRLARHGWSDVDLREANQAGALAAFDRAGARRALADRWGKGGR